MSPVIDDPVNLNTVFVNGLELDLAQIDLKIGTAKQLTASITPFKATNKSVTWSSSNPVVATVSADGLATAISIGSATIRVQTVENYYYKECTVNVSAIRQLHNLDDADVVDCLAALDQAIRNCMNTTDPSASVYGEIVSTNPLTLIVHFSNFSISDYTISGSVTISNPHCTNPCTEYGKITISGFNKTITVVSYDIYYANPSHGTIKIKFTDGTAWTLNAGTGTFTQN